MPRGVPKAKDSPVFTPEKELHTSDLPVAQPAVMSMEDRGEVVVPVEGDPDKEYLAELAFNEDPLTIRIERGTEEFAPLSVPIWVQGIGAEIKNTAGKWTQVGYLPVGIPVITKRKYVEVLARSRVDRVRANQETATPQPGDDGWKLQRTSSQAHSFAVMHDPAGAKGHAWLARIYAER